MENAIHWLNAFPSKTGVSSTLSPSTIVTGRGKPDFSKKHIAFGSYAMVTDGTTNSMKSRTLPAIALKPSNEHGGYYFMSLVSGKRLHSYQWVEAPIPQEIIDRVHELAIKEKQPLLHGGVPVFKWSNGSMVTEVTEDFEEQPIPENNIYTTVKRE